MPNPMRLTAGFTQHAKFQPFQAIGVPDPNFYCDVSDDFVFYVAGRYTPGAVGNGGIAVANRAGGVIGFSTNNSTPLATDYTTLQTNTASQTLTGGVKTAFACRLSLPDAVNPAVNVGIIQQTATPFTVTDGIYINKPSGSAAITVYIVVGSVVKASLAVPNFVIAANTMTDLAFVYEGKDDLLIYAGVGLFGSTPDQNREQLGPIARISGVYSGGMFTTAVLCPTLALQSGTASSKLMYVDFFRSLTER